ncbi:MAG: hypothetical protein WCO02_10845 [Bacteroidota bacterium]
MSDRFELLGCKCKKNRDAGCRMQDARFKMQDAGCKMQDERCRMQDAGCKMQDARCRMQDARCRMQDKNLFHQLSCIPDPVTPPPAW